MDFLSDSDTMSMTNEELGVYMRLLCHDWVDSGLEDNPARLLLRLAHFNQYEEDGSLRDTEPYENCKVAVLSKFIPHPDKPGYITNNRLYNERKKQDNHRHNSSENGKRGGGNPNFKKGKPNPYYQQQDDEKITDKGKDKGVHKANINSSSSSSSSSSLINPPTPFKKKSSKYEEIRKKIIQDKSVPELSYEESVRARAETGERRAAAIAERENIADIL